MNTYFYYDEDFQESDIFKSFNEKYKGLGRLRVHVSAANEAIPISNVLIIIKTVYEGNNIIFFEGNTDNSGNINKITLPTYKNDIDNLDVPKKVEYTIEAIYEEKEILYYKVNIYDDICVIQNINIIPPMMNEGVNRWL